MSSCRVPLGPGELASCVQTGACDVLTVSTATLLVTDP